MNTFREFMDAQIQTPQAGSVSPVQKQQKWKASKEEIMGFWKNLRPDVPIAIKPIDYQHKGSTYGEDGLRLTGSPQFIASVLGRLKEFLNFETPSTKLAISYRQTESPSKTAMGESKTSYVFYLQAKNRGLNQ